MAVTMARVLAALMGLLLLASCGGESEIGAAAPSEEAEVVNPVAEDDPTEPAEDEEGAEPEATTTTTEAPEETTTTTTTEPLPGLTVEQAMDVYEEWTDLQEEYTEALFVSGDATFDQAVAMLAVVDPATLGGELDDVALEWHNCNGQAALEASAFFEFTSLEIDFDHIAQHQIDSETVALETRSFIRLGGAPENVVDSTRYVTVDGLGPSVVTTAEDSSCPVPLSDEAKARKIEIAAFLAELEESS